MKLRVCLAWISVGILSTLQAMEVFAQSTSGISYRYVILFVTVENNTRTNLGLNGYILDSFVKGANPSANMSVRLYDQQGNLAGSGSHVVQPNQLVQVNNIISALIGTVNFLDRTSLKMIQRPRL